MADTGIGAPPSDTQPTPLIVIGASAGGIDAVLTVVSALPAEFPAPVVVAQHLDPDRESHLSDLIASRSNLPVIEVSGRHPITPGTVYIVPARRDVEVTDHQIAAVDRDASRSHPSVDRLMASAAEVFRDNLIGVILTGSGRDGAEGAHAISAYGGTVIVQNPETARYAGMPSSVAPSVVDIVADIEAIGDLLVDLCRGDYASRHSDDDELRAFLDRVREETGLDFSSYKRPTIERRLQRRMLAVGASDLNDYRRHLERDSDELRRLVSSFLIKVTRFFRDAELFDYLRTHALPSLLDDARRRGELRIWSAGCATGEEAYSIAMLLRDMLADDAETLPVRIFATDISPEAIEFARHGVFPETALSDVPSEMIERHFVRIDSGYEVRKPVRSMVIFGEHDLSRRAPFPRIDLVLCRNVLIYFTPDLQRRALQLFAFSLRPGGYLALGKAESVGPLPEYFSLEQSRLKIFRRVGGDAPVPAGSLVETGPARHPAPLHSRRVPVSPAGARDEASRTASEVVRQSVRILDTMAVGVVTVERNYHIRSINVAARTLLNAHAAVIGEDLIHQVSAELGPALRRLIDAAFRGEKQATDQHIARDVIDDAGRDFIISCAPVQYERDSGRIELALIEIVDVTSIAQDRRTLEQERGALEQERHHLHERIVAAVAEVQSLRQADEVMAIEHGRLRAENEQLQLAAEEAQAAAEEIETLNEEQQAANEELETLNEELQATVEELNTTNADLEARTIELESLAAAHELQRAESERERARLHAMLTNMSDAVLLLSPTGEVSLTNPAWDQLVGPPRDLAPEDAQGQPLPESVWSFRRIAEDAPFTVEFTLPAVGGTRQWFEAIVQPVPEAGGHSYMVVARDITDRNLRSLQERFLAVAAHELRTPMTTLSGSIQLLARQVQRKGGDTTLQRLIGRAQEQFRRLEMLIGELTDISRLRGGHLQIDRSPLDLRDVARVAVHTVEPMAKDIEVVLDLPGEPVYILGDGPRLEQVVINLITNAFRHARDTDRVDVRLRRDTDVAVLEVQDYGSGIDQGVRAEIFEQFRQADAETHGLGLGLFIAREIVSAHHGTIELEPASGEGSTFAIHLPLLEASNPDGAGGPSADTTS